MPVDRSVPVPRVLAQERIVAPRTVEAAPSPKAEPFDVLRKLWRHRGLVLLCTFLAAVVGIVVAVSLPSHYVAEARVLVGIPEPRVFSVETYMQVGGSDT